MQTINKFDGQWRFLSNFSPSIIKYEGIEYPTIEHAFQAAKTLDVSLRQRIAEFKTPGESKRLGRQLKLRSDWEQVKDGIMLELVRLKFAIPELRDKLLLTGDAILIEGNTWNDTYWGVCNGKGKNKLGKILFKVREELKLC